MMPAADNTPELTIRDLYPHYTEKQLAEAEDNIERYLTLVLRIFERRELERAEPLTENTGPLPYEGMGANSS